MLYIKNITRVSILLFSILIILCSCERIKYTNDEFDYYLNSNTKNAYITSIPNKEEITIPEYIDGHLVYGLGYLEMGVGYSKEHKINDDNVKSLIVLHNFNTREGFVNFSNLKSLTFLDFIYCNLNSNKDELIVPYYIGDNNSNIPDVSLKISDREYDNTTFKPTVIIIPDYVKLIEKGVFDNLDNVTIKTSYETKPEGWDDNWNGNCNVIWGYDLN